MGQWAWSGEGFRRQAQRGTEVLAACGLAVRSRMRRGMKEAGAWPRHVKCLKREGGGDRSHLGPWYPLG